MKRTLAVLLTLVLCLSLLVGCSNADTPQAEGADPQVNITVVSHFDPEYLSYKACVEACESISEKSNGTITFSYYPLEQLVKSAEEFTAVVDGIGDMAPLYPGSYTGIEPMLGADDQPFEYRDWEDLWAAWNSGHKEIMEEVFAKHNMKLLAVTVPYLNGTMFFSNKEIKVPADLHGQKIRNSSVAGASIISSCGGSSVSMSSSEYYLALSTNTIDGVATAPIPGTDRTLQEVVKYWLNVSMSIPYDYLVINLDTWNKMSENQQALFEEAFGDEYFMNVISHAQEAEDAAKALYDGEGVIQYTPTDEEFQQWYDIGISVSEDWVATNGDLAKEWMEISQSVVGK